MKITDAIQTANDVDLAQYTIMEALGEDCSSLREKLKEKEIMAYICYVPLHSAPMGLRLGYKPEDCPISEDYGARVLRLPLHAEMTTQDAKSVLHEIESAL